MILYRHISSTKKAPLNAIFLAMTIEPLNGEAKFFLLKPQSLKMVAIPISVGVARPCGGWLVI